MVLKFAKLLFIVTLSLTALNSKSNAQYFNVTFDVWAEPHHYDFKTDQDIIKINEICTLMIAMNNEGPDMILGFSMPFRLYGSYDGYDIEHVNIDGDAENGTIKRINGMQPYTGIWPTLNGIFVTSWDGDLPDTVNWSTAGIPLMGGGWPWDMELFNTAYLQFGIRSSEIGQICIDSIEHPDPQYNWLWQSSPQPFEGPYCWNIDTAWVPVSGNISLKNYTTDTYEPFGYAKFDICEFDGSNYNDLAEGVTTNEFGDYFVYIPRTDNEIYFRFSSHMGNPYRDIDKELATYDPCIGIIKSGTTGNDQINYDIAMDRGTDFFNWEPFYQFARIMSDVYTADTLLDNTYGHRLSDDLEIVGILNGNTRWTYEDQVVFVNYAQDHNVQKVCQELGHQYFFELQNDYADTSSPFFGIPNHPINQITDEIFAFNEGFSVFFHSLCTDPDSIVGGYEGETIENNKWWYGYDGEYDTSDSGEIVVGAVASILFDIYDDTDNPGLRFPNQDDDDVLNTPYMKSIVYNCIDLFASDPQRTLTLTQYADRLVRNTSVPWYNDPFFMDLRDPICDVFSNHGFRGVLNKSGYDFCKPSFLPNENDDSPEVPFHFEVNQNYPNPFNSNTRISFTLPSDGSITLEIINILGKTMIRENIDNLQLGENTIDLDMLKLESLSSGIYFYRISYDNVSITKKMMLLK